MFYVRNEVIKDTSLMEREVYEQTPLLTAVCTIARLLELFQFLPPTERKHHTAGSCCTYSDPARFLQRVCPEDQRWTKECSGAMNPDRGPIIKISYTVFTEGLVLKVKFTNDYENRGLVLNTCSRAIGWD